MFRMPCLKSRLSSTLRNNCGPTLYIIYLKIKDDLLHLANVSFHGFMYTCGDLHGSGVHTDQAIHFLPSFILLLPFGRSHRMRNGANPEGMLRLMITPTCPRCLTDTLLHHIAWLSSKPLASPLDKRTNDVRQCTSRRLLL